MLGQVQSILLPGKLVATNEKTVVATTPNEKKTVVRSMFTPRAAELLSFLTMTPKSKEETPKANAIAAKKANQ